MQETNDVKLRPVYFQPRQLVFQAYGNLQNTGATQALMSWANGLAESRGITITPFEDNVLDFSPVFQNPDQDGEGPIFAKKSNLPANRPAMTTGRPAKPGSTYQSPPVKIPPPFSLVFANVKNLKWSDPLIDSNQEETDEQAKEQIAAMNELLDLIIFLDENRETAPVRLEAVSPNWLFSGSSRPGGTGGPGGKPSPVKLEDLIDHHIAILPPDTSSALPVEFSRVSQADGGKDIVVVILDTSYTPEQLEGFYQKWVEEKIKKGEAPHPVIRDLLGKDAHPGAMRDASGRLRVELEPSVDRYLRDLIIDGHNYDMTDHGLFVAGIINSLAPQAEIHLYQVLNKHGIGDMYTIARAFQWATQSFPGRQVAINASLTMELPLDLGNINTNDDFGIGKAILKRKPWWLAEWLAQLVAGLFNKIFRGQFLCGCDSWFNRQTKALEWISDLVYAGNSRVIAAAGNGSRGRPSRLPALYPAAFDRVFGVGALAKDSLTPASYSNLSDTPSSTGIITLGGEEGDKKGILGVFMGEFPKGASDAPQSNDNGWAWWCGTSFATPIVSGITAAVRSTMPPDCTIEDAVEELFKVHTRNTDIEEDILSVKQG